MRAGFPSFRQEIARIAQGGGGCVPSYSEQSAADGGEGGIRTPGGREPSTVFKTAAIDHSATSPGKPALAARLN